MVTRGANAGRIYRNPMLGSFRCCVARRGLPSSNMGKLNPYVGQKGLSNLLMSDDPLASWSQGSGTPRRTLLPRCACLQHFFYARPRELRYSRGGVGAGWPSGHAKLAELELLIKRGPNQNSGNWFGSLWQNLNTRVRVPDLILVLQFFSIYFRI